MELSRLVWGDFQVLILVFTFSIALVGDLVLRQTLLVWDQRSISREAKILGIGLEQIELYQTRW